MPRRRANAMVRSIVDQPPTRAEQIFANLVVGAMVISGIMLIAL